MFEDENGEVINYIIDSKNENSFYFLNYCDNFLTSILELAVKNKWESVDINLKEKDIKKWNSEKYTLEYFRKHGYNKEIILSIIKEYCFVC